MSRRNNNLAAKSLSDKQLMAALKRANPAKYGEGAPAEISAPKSAEATPVRTERESRALAEVMATAGCTVGLKDHSDPVKRSRDVKKMFTEAVGVKNEAIAEQPACANHQRDKSRAVVDGIRTISGRNCARPGN